MFYLLGNLTSMLRGQVYAILGVLHTDYVIKKFKALFADHVNGTQEIDTNMRSAVYACVVTHGDGETLKEMKDLYFKSDIVDEKQRVLSHLGRFQNRELRNEVLQFCISVSGRLDDP